MPCAPCWTPERAPRRRMRTETLLSMKLLPKATWSACAPCWTPERAPRRRIRTQTLLSTSLPFGATWSACAALLDAGASTTAENEDRDTPLHLASSKGHVECVRALLDAGASTTAANEDRDTPLHSASSGGHVECVRALLDAGASTMADNMDGDTPLHSASLEATWSAAPCWTPKRVPWRRIRMGRLPLRLPNQMLCAQPSMWDFNLHTYICRLLVLASSIVPEKIFGIIGNSR